MPVPASAPNTALRRQTWIWAGVGAALVALVWLLGPILTPFAIAGVLAYIFDPLVERLTTPRISRTLASTLVILLVLAVVALLILILVPLVQQEAAQLVQRLPQWLDAAQARLAPWLRDSFGVELQLDLETVRRLLQKHWSSAGNVAMELFQRIAGGGAALLAVLSNLLIAPVVMFYLMRDWNTFGARVGQLIPRPWYARSMRMLGDMDAVLAEFLRGQLLVMLALAVYYTLGLWLAGVQFALPVGVMTGLLVFIPYVGFASGFLLALLVAALQLQGWTPVVGVLAVYGLGQLIESFALTPYLVGERIGLHPLAVIFALMAFGQLFGFVGVLIALPASAALLVALRELRGEYFGSRFYRGDEPPEAA